MSDLSDAVETANAVLEWERERNPDLGSRELAQRLINQIVASGCVVPASEVERLREAGEELTTEIDDEIIRSVMIKHDSPDAVERARGAVERYRAALKASDGEANVPAT